VSSPGQNKEISKNKEEAQTCDTEEEKGINKESITIDQRSPKIKRSPSKSF